MVASRRLLLSGAAAASVCFALLATPSAERSGAVRVFAPASLADALKAAGAAWRGNGGEVTPVYAGSGALARQIAAGAPADLVISANPEWMDWLEARGLIEARSRIDLLSNRLVLIAGPAAAPLQESIRLDATLDMNTLLNGGRLAMALTEAVPAGIYGRAALRSFDLWNAVAPHVVEAENVRVALALVARGEAPLGIVYETDAQVEPRVRVLARFPAESHPPITYPAALASGAPDRARALLAFLAGREARKIFASYGFAPSAPVRMAGSPLLR